MSPKCELCQINLADQTNSHIIPLFLIANLLSKDGKARDREVLGVLAPKDFPKLFLGREMTSPEKVIEFLGRDYTEGEIESNKNPLTRDNILCRECEKKLSALEGFVAGNIYNEFVKLPIVKIGTKEYKELSNENAAIFKLFILSIIWRCSITEFADYKLKASIKKKLRCVLKNNLSTNFNETLANIELVKANVKNFTLLVLCQGNTNKNIPKDHNTILVYNKSNPNYFILNEFIVCFFLDFKNCFAYLDRFLEISSHFNKSDFKHVVYNKIKIIPTEKFNEINLRAAKVLVSVKIRQFNDVFRQMYKLHFGFFPSKELENDFLSKLIYTSDAKLDKYSIEHFKRIAKIYLR